MLRFLVKSAPAVALVLALLWLANLPEPVEATAPAVPAAEQAQLLQMLRPANGQRPLVAMVAINDATETTDYLMPAGILRRADVANVMLLATKPGPVQLYPALRVWPDATLADFDAAFPQGADYVIVPAMSRKDDDINAWLVAQDSRGAKIIGICAGAKVVATAGLLDGKRATTHWYNRDQMLRAHPLIHYVADRRIVGDEGVVTTTGISASMPMMLTLIEAIAGHDKALETAHSLGISQWDARHASAAFRLSRPFALTVLRNRAQVWRRETLALPLEPGMDEVALALTADSWSRTYRATVKTVAEAPIVTANGITVLPDEIASSTHLPLPALPAARALDATLAAIGERYGQSTAEMVAMQLEYPTKATPGW